MQCLSYKKNNINERCPNITNEKPTFCQKEHSICTDKYKNYKSICKEADIYGTCKYVNPDEMTNDEIDKFLRLYQLIKVRHKECSNKRTTFKDECIFKNLQDKPHDYQIKRGIDISQNCDDMINLLANKKINNVQQQKLREKEYQDFLNRQRMNDLKITKEIKEIKDKRIKQKKPKNISQTIKIDSQNLQDEDKVIEEFLKMSKQESVENLQKQQNINIEDSQIKTSHIYFLNKIFFNKELSPEDIIKDPNLDLTYTNLINDIVDEIPVNKYKSVLLNLQNILLKNYKRLINIIKNKVIKKIEEDNSTLLLSPQQKADLIEVTQIKEIENNKDHFENIIMNNIPVDKINTLFDYIPKKFTSLLSLKLNISDKDTFLYLLELFIMYISFLLFEFLTLHPDILNKQSIGKNYYKINKLLESAGNYYINYLISLINFLLPTNEKFF